MRDASGWRVEEPMPTRNTEINTAVSEDENANRIIPSVVEIMPMGRLATIGRRSNASPTTGWKTDAAI